LRIKILAMSVREIGDGRFDFRHTGAAVPAGGEVRVNLRSATGWEFAIRSQKQLLI
jgi:hypothetical protein